MINKKSKTYKTLVKEVRNYNNRVKRALKKNPQYKEFYPELISLKEYTKGVNTYADLRRKTNLLKKATRYTLTPIVNDKGLEATWYDVIKVRELSNQVNNVRAKGRKKHKLDELGIKKVNFNKIRNKTELNKIIKSLERQSQIDYFDTSFTKFKDTYLKQLKEMYSNYKGFSNLYGRLKKLEPEEFYRYTESNPLLSFAFMYLDPMEMSTKIEAMLENAP